MDNVYELHEKLGFPALTEQEQAEVLMWNRIEIINNLTPGFQPQYIPISVRKKYIKLSKDRFRHFLLSNGYIETLWKNHIKDPIADGIWVEQTNDFKWAFINQERGIIDKQYFQNHEALVQFLVERLYQAAGFS